MAVALLLAAAPASAETPTAAVDVTLTIDTAHPGPVIEPAVYGQFAEHLGHGIYGGIWVGPDSPIPNIRGYRKDVVDALRRLHVPVIRWPGGCFADEYDWRDGIGPRAKRPARVNTNWGGVIETNAFGTHEFMDFADLIGADAYVAGNMGSMAPRDMAQWVEYMTSPLPSSLALERRANGRAAPWRLKYFGVGNESWGCGGNMRPEFAADMYKRYATFLKSPAGAPPIIKVASGANGDDYHWTEVMMRDAASQIDAISMHYYTLNNGWAHKGRATGFDEAGWASQLAQARRMDELVTRHSAIMDKYDPAKRVALYIDEWGTWYDQEPGSTPGFLYQQNTLRDAEVAALTLDIFHRHTDRVKLAAIAQMVNVLQAMILTDGARMVLTPTYHVFEMYEPFQGATPYPVRIDTPDYTVAGTTLPIVDASAARGRDGKLWLALVNLDPDRAAQVTTAIPGTASGRMLTAARMDAHNSFDQPNVVVPQPFAGRRVGDRLVFELPAKSIAVVGIE
jgi:alpha-N-arabinofuranosidase